MTQFNTTLDAVKRLSTTGAVTIHVPSLNKTVKFKQLTTKQQKDIVKTAIDKSTPGLLFYNSVNTVIRDNNLEPTAGVINSVDRLFIITALRAACLSKELKIKDKVVDIAELVAKPHLIHVADLSKIITTDSISIKCVAPTLDYDSEVTTECIRKATNESLVTALGETFIGEIVKYVESIDINSTTIALRECSLNQRFQLIESLPASVNNEILLFISAIKELESRFVEVDGKKESIDLDQAFFTV